MERNPFTYGSPLTPGEGIGRPEDAQFLLQMAESGQNTRVSAPRRYGKTTLIEELRADAERAGLNTVRVDLYGVMSGMDIAVRLERAYRNLRGPVERSVEKILARIKLKGSAGVGVAKVSAESMNRTDSAEARQLIELLDLPAEFHRRKGARTLVVFDEFQDVLQAGQGIDGVIRSRIQHQREAASYLFAGSHPGMLDELFGDRSRPLFDQARPLVLEPLNPLAVAEYVEQKFAATSRSAGRQLDALIELAGGHPQRVMMLAHHLWERTLAGERATEEGWNEAVAAVFSELQEQYERAWSEGTTQAEREALAAVAAGRSELLAASTLRSLRVSKSTAARVRKQLLRSGDLRSDADGRVHLVDPLYAAWVEAGRRPPQLAQRKSPPQDRADDTPLSPFGVPDGARASLGEFGHGYIQVGGARGRRDNRMTRVVVGRKGSGKTLWLRRQMASLQAEDSVYVADSGFSLPLTSDVILVSDWYPPALLRETWSAIWRVALLRTVASHIQANLSPGSPILLKVPGLIPERAHLPVSLRSEIQDMIACHGSRRALDDYLRRPEWERAEEAIEEALRFAPPVYLIFDGLDEEFEQAPSYWLRAQQGLFMEALRLLRDRSLGGRLHVSLGLRDFAYSSLLETEHSTRFLDNPFVHVLRWDEESIGRLLEEKLAGLGSSCLIDPSRGQTFEGWLGSAVLSDLEDSDQEPVETFLIRHTRMLPRDTVLMGNALCRLVVKAKDEARKNLSVRDIERTIKHTAELIGREQLRICANQISAGMIPRGAAASRYDSIYTGANDSRDDGAYVKGIERDLRAALSAVGMNRFDREGIKTLARWLEEAFGDPEDGLAALWQTGILGYMADDSLPVFYGASEFGELKMPSGCSEFAFHPGVVRALNLGRIVTSRPRAA